MLVALNLLKYVFFVIMYECNAFLKNALKNNKSADKVDITQKEIKELVTVSFYFYLSIIVYKKYLENLE